MKYKHTITIADIQMNIVTEEEPEAVEAIVGILDRRIREIFLKSENRCPKIEAALLCALDYCAEKNKLQETVNRMEEEMRGVDVDAMIAELAELKNENESLRNKLTYTEDQAHTMKNGIDIANDQIRLLKDKLEKAESGVSERIAELERTVAEKDAEIGSKDDELEQKTAELETKSLEIETLNLELEAKNLELDAKNVENVECEDIAVEDVKTCDNECVTDETVVPDTENEEAITEQTIECAENAGEQLTIVDDTTDNVIDNAADKRPVSAIAENVEEAFEIEMRPLRRNNAEENQLTIDSRDDEQAEKADEKPSMEKEKQKAQKRVRSMFDLISFDNV